MTVNGDSQFVGITATTLAATNTYTKFDWLVNELCGLLLDFNVRKWEIYYLGIDNIICLAVFLRFIQTWNNALV